MVWYILTVNVPEFMVLLQLQYYAKPNFLI